PFHDPDADYEAWRRRRELTAADRERLRAEAAAMPHPPRLSVLLPVADEADLSLRHTLESVLRQTYPHWEMCVAAEGCLPPAALGLLAEYQQREPRIKVTARASATAAVNGALDLAAGEYVLVVDPGDELAEHALSEVARATAANPRPDMLYS